MNPYRSHESREHGFCFCPVSASRLQGFTCIAMLLGIAATGYALDPNHKLTQYVHRIWQTQPGLPQTNIFTVRQTRAGYLWLGTESGIVRFDGVRFAHVPELDMGPLADIRARGFAEDARGRMWIVSSNLGAVSIGNGATKSFTAAEGLPQGEINCLFATAAGEFALRIP